MTAETPVKSKSHEPDGVTHEPGTDREEMIDNDLTPLEAAKARAAETIKPRPLSDNDVGKPTPAERHRRSRDAVHEDGCMMDATDGDMARGG